MKVAIYSRKSKFTGVGESTQNQIDMCKEYANRNFKVDEFVIYEDEGFSGGNVDRPQFQKMVKDALKGKFEVLMCYRLDRISRNISDFSDTIETLQEHNISFVSLREQFDTSTPMGRAMMFIASVFAQLERETIAERIRDNMMQLARTGRWLGGVSPTGFASEAVAYYDHEGKEKKMQRLIPIPEELSIVKTIYQKYIDEGSLTRLESWCFENNLKSKNGKFFDKTALKSILTNPVYAVADEVIYEYFANAKSDMGNSKSEFNGRHGLMVYNKKIEKRGKGHKARDISEWIISIGKHPGIIPSTQWIRVQNQLEEQSAKAPRTDTSSIGLITSLLRCSCGSSMRLSMGRKVKSGNQHYYYKCILKERSRGSQCKENNINGTLADQNVKDALKAHASKESDYAKRLEKKKVQIEKDTNNKDKDMAKLKKELQQQEEAIGNLTMQLAQNQSSIASKYIINQIEAIDKRINEIKSILNSIDEDRELTLYEQQNIEMIQGLMKNVAVNIDNLSHDEQKKLLRTVIEDIQWDGTRLHVNIIGSKYFQ